MADVDPVVDLLIEHDEVTLELADDGTILVRNTALGTMKVTSLADLPALLTDPGAWTPKDPRRIDPRDWAPRGTVLKAAPDLDLYCVWSGNADNVAHIGDRANMLAEGITPARLARADRYGTSSVWARPPAGYPVPYRPDGWDDGGLLVREQDHAPDHGTGWLPRTRLAEFLRAKAAGDEKAAGALLDRTNNTQED